MGFLDIILILTAGGLVGIAIIVLVIARHSYREPPDGYTLVITGGGKEIVASSGAIVWPVIRMGQFVDMMPKTVSISRSGGEGLICQDCIRADVKIAFQVRVGPTEEEVLRVVRSIGAERAASVDTLEQLFTAKFQEAAKSIAKTVDFADLQENQDEVAGRIHEAIGTDLNGYRLETVAFLSCEQVTIEQMDPNNILDAQGIANLMGKKPSKRRKSSPMGVPTDKAASIKDGDCRLRVLYDHGKIDRTITATATPTTVRRTMDKIDWQEFHQVVLEQANGDSLEAGGSLETDGLCIVRVTNNSQHIMTTATTVDDMTEVLLASLSDKADWHAAFQWE